MFLGVRLAHVRTRERVDVNVALRHRLNLQHVEGKAGARMDEARPHGFVAIIRINGNGAEAADQFARRQVSNETATKREGVTR